MSNRKLDLRRLTFFKTAILAAFCVSGFAQTAPVNNPELAKGAVIPKVVTLADSQQSYALFLPSTYTPSRIWPIIYAFDPMARGVIPTKLLKDAAEKYGYIVAGSNNAKNGPIGPQTEAAQAMWKDTHQRFAINEDRIYMTGFSGGARLATGLALQCKCVVGVFGHGAGFPARVPPSRQNQFLFFGAVGDADFNYPEMVELSKQLDGAGFTSRIRHFDGPHQWAPPEVAMEAIEWFELHAMKKGLRPADQEFISVQFQEASKQAKQLEAAADTIGAYDAYNKLVQDFQGLKETKEFADKTAEIGKSKVYRDAQKREQNEIKRQDALIADIARNSATLRSDPGERQTLLMQLRGQLSNLRNAAQKQNDESKLTKRALNQVSVMLFENAEEDLRKRDFALALMQYDLLSEIQPDSPRPLVHKARVYALSGDKKKAIASLRQAAEHGFKDFAQVKENPDFASLAGDPEFKKLVNSTPQAGSVQQ
jgi:dienelactone hydrolase